MRIALTGLAAVSCLLAGSHLMLTADTSQGTFQGFAACVAGLILAVAFSCLWARSLEDRSHNSRRRP